jgi:hypothetical protein
MFLTHSHRQGSIELVKMKDLVLQGSLVAQDRRHHRLFVHRGKDPTVILRGQRASLRGPGDVVQNVVHRVIGYLFGIHSERRLVEEVWVNVAYRWFVGLSLTDKVPHATTFSQNRRRGFNGTTIFQEIFDEIILQAIYHGLIEGKEMFTDSTFLKANANKNKFTRQMVRQSTEKYVEELSCR